MTSPEETAALLLEIEQRRQKRVATTRSVLASDQVLEDYASKPLLSTAEAVAIMQGFTPPVGEYSDEQIFYLDDHADSVQRLLTDGRRGTLPLPCRPQEFVVWSATAGVDLPIAFVRAVRTDLIPTAAAALLRDMQDVAEPATQSGDHLDDNGYDPELQTQANQLARTMREAKGRWPTKNAVAKKLSQQREETVSLRRFRNEWNPGPTRSLRRAKAQLRVCAAKK